MGAPLPPDPFEPAVDPDRAPPVAYPATNELLGCAVEWLVTSTSPSMLGTPVSTLCAQFVAWHHPHARDRGQTPERVTEAWFAALLDELGYSGSRPPLVVIHR